MLCTGGHGWSRSFAARSGGRKSDWASSMRSSQVYRARKGVDVLGLEAYGTA